ncbi:hypothetical protein GFS31_40950 (plasmid) [Leptolyngbya sp. BL0902]|nr:hypothetical protein GFS31_40950 [Leptolyngbya sp. BL0902]
MSSLASRESLRGWSNHSIHIVSIQMSSLASRELEVIYRDAFDEREFPFK